MPIVYCLIARGVVVECDVSHPLHSGNFKLVALKLLDKVHRQHEAASAPPASLHDSTSNPLRRQTLLFDHHTFNFLSLGPLHCLALCTADVKQHTAFLFLADVLETYRSGRGEDSGGRVDGHTLKAITDSLHSKMEQYNHSSTQHTDSSSQQQQQERRGEEADENQDRRRQRQQRDRKERERGGKHGGKSSKRPVFSSSPGTEGVGPQGEPTGDNPDAVHNVKRELEVSKCVAHTLLLASSSLPSRHLHRSHTVCLH